MTPERRYAALSARFHQQPDIGTKRGFGTAALTVGGRIFAFLHRDRLVVKLPAGRVAALVAAEVAVPFENGAGRVMRGWVAVDAAAAWDALAEEAYGFVAGGLRP